MSKITVYFNGIEYSVDEDLTILEAAKENNIFIPTFCNDERLK